jgi:hypothetical protein
MGDRPVAGWAASRHLEGTQAIQSTGLPRMAGCHARNNEPRDKALAPLRDLTDETMEQVRRAPVLMSLRAKIRQINRLVSG